MANTKSAAKRARQTERRTIQNRRVLSSVKSALKKVRAEIGAGNKIATRDVVSALDRAAKSGRIHRNAANRHKSRLNKLVKA